MYLLLQHWPEEKEGSSNTNWSSGAAQYNHSPVAPLVAIKG